MVVVATWLTFGEVLRFLQSFDDFLVLLDVLQVLLILCENFMLALKSAFRLFS